MAAMRFGFMRRLWPDGTATAIGAQPRILLGKACWAAASRRSLGRVYRKLTTAKPAAFGFQLRSESMSRTCEHWNGASTAVASREFARRVCPYRSRFDGE